MSVWGEYIEWGQMYGGVSVRGEAGRYEGRCMGKVGKRKRGPGVARRGRCLREE